MKKLFFVFILVSCGSAAEHNQGTNLKSEQKSDENKPPKILDNTDYKIDFSNVAALVSSNINLSLVGEGNSEGTYVIKKDNSFGILSTPKNYKFKRTLKAKTGSLVEFEQQKFNLETPKTLLYWLPKEGTKADLLAENGVLIGDNFLGENSVGNLYFKPSFKDKERILTVYNTKEKTLNTIKTSIPDAQFSPLSKDSLAIYNYKNSQQIFHTVIDKRINISNVDFVSINSTKILIRDWGNSILDITDGSMTTASNQNITPEVLKNGVEINNNIVSLSVTFDGENVYRQLVSINENLDVLSLVDLRPFQTDVSDQMFSMSGNKFAFKGLNKIYLATPNEQGSYDVSFILEDLNITSLDVNGPYIYYSAEDAKGNRLVASYDTTTGKTNIFSNSLSIESITSL
jgi:hypothetical protein